MKRTDVKQVADMIRNKVPAKMLVNTQKNSVANGPFQTKSHKIIVRTQPIAIGIPMDEVWFGKTVKRLFELDLMPWDMKLFVSSTYVPDARNKIHSAFLESKYEYLFMMDSDTGGPFDVIDRLLKHKKQVVCGWYPAKMEDHSKIYPVVYDYEGYKKQVNLTKTDSIITNEEKNQAQG